MEAASVQGQASQNPMPRAGTARMVTKTIGFRLGPLEVDYSTRKVEFDASRAGQSAPRVDMAASSGEVSARSRSSARVEAGSDHPDPLWRRALAAYARAASQADQEPDQDPGTLSAVG